MSKKDKHARNQAKYMERKRAAGLEWLTEWVPTPAYDALKSIAKAARKSHTPPSETLLIQAGDLAVVPEWAKSSEILLSVWMTSTVAAKALEQVQADREANKSKKSSAKSDKDEEDAEEEVPQPQTIPPEAPAE